MLAGRVDGVGMTLESRACVVLGRSGSVWVTLRLCEGSKSADGQTPTQTEARLNQPMTPRIEISREKKLVGQSLRMSFADYKIGELWRAFLPRRREISNPLTDDLISLVIYPPHHFEHFQPTNEFERWAAVEVADFQSVPHGMGTFIVPSGRYAVFVHRGDQTELAQAFQSILTTWLPNSEYALDDRPHFEVLGAKYKNHDPGSEEEIWIPVKAK